MAREPAPAELSAPPTAAARDAPESRAPESLGPPEFARVFEELAPYVLRVLPRMGVASADLDDVAQDVFLTVHKALPKFEGRSSVRTWVYGICIRVAGNYRQRAHRRYERLAAEDVEQVDARDPARDLDAQRRLAALDSALGTLSDAQRAVFVLHEIEQLPIAEIAAALEAPKFTIYARLYAARRSVRAQLGVGEPEDRHE